MLDTYNVNFSRISQEILQAQINPHLANNPILQPLKTTQNQIFSGFPRGTKEEQ